MNKYILLIACVVVLGGCAQKEVLLLEVVSPVEVVPPLPGVDSVFASMADDYQGRGRLVDLQSAEQSRQAVNGGRKLFAVADSLISAFQSSQDTSVVTEDQVAESIERFNAGADALQSPQLGMGELRKAEAEFRKALDLNPYDEEALYWLSQVYELQAERLMESGAVTEMIVAVTRLVELAPFRHDYAALLASAYESVGTVEGWSDAGSWWHRASALLQDAPNLSLEETVVDTSIVFIYLANASRAFIEGDQGDMAIATVDEASPFALTAEEKDYLLAERQWLTWDIEVSNRKEYDRLLALSVESPDSAVIGLKSLLRRVSLPQSLIDVRHQLSLSLYNAGNSTEGVTELQTTWGEVQTQGGEQMERVREDYGTMLYEIALEHRASGELRNALAYLLQSEATGFRGAAQSSLTLSILLRTDAEASLEAALRAEQGWDGLGVASQRTLLQHMVDIHRRLNNRDQAAEYALRYRNLQQ